MIENFVDSALIIDDKENEISKLKELLDEKDIWTKYYSPEQLKNLAAPLKNRKIIFLDLYVDDKVTEIVGQLSIIRKMFEKSLGFNFGIYGLVLWSAHLDEINELKKRIKNDADKYSLPLFIIGLDKKKYMRSGYGDLFKDLNIELSKNVAASFFVAWSSLVNKGKDSAITNIFTLIKDYEIQDENLRFVLFQLARNLTGIPIDKIEEYPLHRDAYIAFNDMMNYEITKELKIDDNIFKDPKSIQFFGLNQITKKYKRRGPREFYYENSSVAEDDPTHGDNIKALINEIEFIYSQINSRTLFDEYNLDKNNILPGNIYKIIDDKSTFIIEDKPKDSVAVVIEMTPKCDFSNKNILNHRLLAGYIYDYDKTKLNKVKGYIYKEIHPIHISSKSNPQMLLFDFRIFGSIQATELLNPKKYELLFRAKDRLFADILQKLSSHLARLGVAIIH